jgi:polysaccharide biosynthesis/export protein
MKRLFLVMFTLLLANSATSAQTVPRPAARATESTGAPPSDDVYVIGPEDVLSINVWKEPDITKEVIVRPDGKIGMPLLGDVQASGLTPGQLQDRIAEGLKKYVSGPTVSVIVNAIHSHVVYITGRVGSAGVYVLGAPTTIIELLIRAGGLGEFAKSEEIQILRKEGNEVQRLRFNYKQFIEGKDYKQNILLRRGDIVIVP